MLLYLQSDEVDPYYNLALEQYVFDRLDRTHSYFMLWQNRNAIIVGKHQNTAEEISAAFVKERGIAVVRRLSGGGAVYHDLGNLNFTFITNATDNSFDFSVFCEPVAQALRSFGVDVEVSGRNDMTIEGKKISGNAQYCKQGRIMHHGTLLYDSDLSVLAEALTVSPDKIASKGIRSVRSRVTNIKPYLPEALSVLDFRDALRDYMTRAAGLQPYFLTGADNQAVLLLREDYKKWEWNYGASPAHSIRKERRVDGCGTLTVYMDVGKDGILREIAFYGDYFGRLDSRELASLLQGARLEEQVLRELLGSVELGAYFGGLTQEDFLTLLFQ